MQVLDTLECAHKTLGGFYYVNGIELKAEDKFEIKFHCYTSAMLV